MECCWETFQAEAQAEERHRSSVETWIDDGENIPTERRKASELFPLYKDYLDEQFPNEVRFANVQKFGKELTRLCTDRHARIEMTNQHGTSRYRIIPNDRQKKVIELRECVKGSMRH